MRILSTAVLLSASLLLAACGDKPAAQQPSGEATPPAKTANPLAGLTEDANKLVGDANAKIEAAKAEVAKYQQQVDTFIKEKGGLEAKLAEAQKAYDGIMADAKAKVAPLQEKLDEINKQIKALEGLPGFGAATVSGPARAGLDLGGLAGKGGEKIAALKAEADKYQKQIDDILGKAKELGLPYTEQITAYTGQIKSLSESLGKAQGLLAAAQQNLASLTAPSK